MNFATKTDKKAQLQLRSFYNSWKAIDKICRDIQNQCTNLNKKQINRIIKKYLQAFSSIYRVLMFEKKKC